MHGGWNQLFASSLLYRFLIDFGPQLGSKLGGLGAILAPSWGVLGQYWLQVGGLGAILAPSWGSWGHLGSKLGGLGAILAPSWGSWGHHGSKLGGLGAILAPSWGVLGPSWLQVLQLEARAVSYTHLTLPTTHDV